MSGIAEQNLALLDRRWPVLAAEVITAPIPQSVEWCSPAGRPTLQIGGQRLWSAYDAEAEARIQASDVPPDSGQAWVYGVGGGDLIRELLHRPALKRLHVVVMHPGLFLVLLHSLDHRDWLADPRVILQDGQRHNAPNMPFAVIPPCLALCSTQAAPLRDQLIDIQVRAFERERLNKREPQRKKQIQRNRTLIETDGDVAELFGSAKHGSIFVALAGPTLEHTAVWLAGHRSEGILIAVDGALKPLLERGIVPDVVVSIDEQRETILRYFDTDLAACRNSTLVYAPLVHNDVLRLWPGRRLTSYTFETIYDDCRKWIPKAELFVAGSVSHPAVDLAVRMGANRVTLFGADFGFPSGKIHANDQAPVKFYANAARAGEHVRNGHGQPIPTITSFNGYRLGLERYISHQPRVAFINTSREGAYIEGTSYMDDDRP